MTANYHIVTAKPSDARALNRYIRKIYATSHHLITRPDEFGTSPIRQRFWISRKAANPFEVCYLAKDANGRIIGMLDSWTDRRMRVRHVTTFAMSVADRYRCRGVGSALLDRFCAFVAAHDILSKIELHVHADNDHAIALYQKHGFAVEGNRKGAIRYEDGRIVDDIIMAKWPKEGPNTGSKKGEYPG